MKKLRRLEVIKEEVKEPKYEYIEKLATISDDKKSLLIRIPQEIRKHFKISPGDKIRFFAKFDANKKPKLEIELKK